MPSLTFWNLNKCHYEQQKFQWIKHNRISLVQASNAPIFFMSTMDNMQYILKEEATIKEEAYIEVEVPSISNKDMPELPVEIPSISSKDTMPELPVQIQEANGTIIENERSDINDDNDSGENTADDSEVLDNVEDDVDGSRLDEEYANIIALNKNEQKAASEICKLFSHGKQKCKVCQKGFQNEERLKVHMRMHDRVSLFYIITAYYKTKSSPCLPFCLILQKILLKDFDMGFTIT